MKRYMVFLGDYEVPNEGMDSFVESFDIYEDSVTYVKKELKEFYYESKTCLWFQIFDLETEETILRSFSEYDYAKSLAAGRERKKSLSNNKIFI